MGKTHKESIRLTFDLPANLHTHVKVAAAKEGISMRTYIMDSLIYKLEHEEKVDLDNDTFQKELAKMTKKDAKLIRDLSDK